MKKESALSPIASFDKSLLSQEGTMHRQRLRYQLQLEEALKFRSVFRIGDVHCELYENDRSNVPVILFLAGMGTYCELYARLLYGLSRKGFHVVGVDLRGHGYSAGRRGALTVDMAVADLAGVLDALETHYSGPFWVYGYSIGATLGASLGATDERIRALICNTLLLPEVPPDSLHAFGWNWTMMSAFWFPDYQVPLQHFLDFKTLIIRVGAAAALEIEKDPLLVDRYPLKTLSSLFNTRTGLLDIQRKLPVALIHGDADEVLPLSYSERLCQLSPVSIDLIPLNGHGHMLPWTNVDLNIALVSEWGRGIE
jgi:pimeloyl-ACP methyl ester carboxylesterase